MGLLQEAAEPWVGRERMVWRLLRVVQRSVTCCQYVYNTEAVASAGLWRTVQELCRCADCAFWAHAAAYASTSYPTANAKAADAGASSNASTSSASRRFLYAEHRLHHQRMVERCDLCELVPNARRA